MDAPYYNGEPGALPSDREWDAREAAEPLDAPKGFFYDHCRSCYGRTMPEQLQAYDGICGDCARRAKGAA